MKFFTVPALCCLIPVGQAQWLQRETGVKSSLRGLSAISRNVAWAGGTQGTILRTADGGASWQRISPAGSESLDFRDIEAFDASSAYVLSAGVGSASRIYFTADAGRTWKLLVSNSNGKGFWDAIAFWDRRRGLLAGDPIDGVFDVRMTADGGQSWSRPEHPPAARDGEGAFAASGSCLITGSRGRAWLVSGGVGGGRIFETRDWGRTWRAAELPLAHPAASTGAFSVAFEGTRHGVVVGGDYQKTAEGASHTTFTADGGRTWKPATGSRQFLSAVLRRRGLWIATGPAGTEVSSDRGASWRAFSATGFHALSAARDGSIWAAGAEGRVARMNSLLAPGGT